jgi:hypothetical protein
MSLVSTMIDDVFAGDLGLDAIYYPGLGAAGQPCRVRRRNLDALAQGAGVGFAQNSELYRVPVSQIPQPLPGGYLVITLADGTITTRLIQGVPERIEKHGAIWTLDTRALDLGEVSP